MKNGPAISVTVLSRPQFLNQLRLEKRRVDRSKACLSLALFSFEGGASYNDKAIQEFITSLRNMTRATDVVGWVDDHTIGLLLPDTDAKGANKCVDKISKGDGALCNSTVLAMYPDHLFDKLLAENEAKPDLYPLDLDHRKESKSIETWLKRILDVVGAILGLIVSSPLIVLAALAVKWTSPGPVIFRQVRLGQEGTRFTFYKIRSMYSNGNDKIHKDYVADLIKGNLDRINQEDVDNPFYKMKADPRVTPVGKIIRKLSIDELPQFVNVLKGDMSLVGPRPPLLYEVEKYEPWHLRRILEVKPGITGLWQVEGRSRTSFDDMVRLDLRYAQNWSVGLDVKILLKTVRAVIRPNGAE